MANNILLHTRLRKKYIFYVAKYSQSVHDTISVRNLFDEDWLPTTTNQIVTGKKPIVRYFRVFGCPIIFRRYEVSDKETRIKNYNKVWGGSLLDY